jgi:hypothetical protein
MKGFPVVPVPLPRTQKTFRVCITLSPAGRGRGNGEGADDPLRYGGAHLTLPSRCDGPLPLLPEGRRGALPHEYRPEWEACRS